MAGGGGVKRDHPSSLTRLNLTTSATTSSRPDGKGQPASRVCPALSPPGAGCCPVCLTIAPAPFEAGAGAWFEASFLC